MISRLPMKLDSTDLEQMKPVQQFVPDLYKPYVGQITKYNWFVEDEDNDNAYYVFLGFEVWEEVVNSQEMYTEVCAKFLREGEILRFGLWGEYNSGPIDVNSKTTTNRIQRTLKWNPAIPQQ